MTGRPLSPRLKIALSLHERFNPPPAFFSVNRTHASITDFQHGTDHIALAAAVFRKTGGTGALDDAFFTASAPTTGDHHVIYDSTTGVLSYDVDGSGAKPTIAFVQVTSGTVLDHHDFLMV